MAPDTPPIADLLARFLTRQAESRSAGISEIPVNEVEPFEAAAFPMIEPRTAWSEATLALQLLDPQKVPATVAPPPDWAGMVASPLAMLAVPFAAGNYPQLVRDLPALIRTPSRSELRPKSEPSTGNSGLGNWAAQAIRRREFPAALLAIGALRLSHELSAASDMLEELRPHVPARWQAAFANEEAALAWHNGDADKAHDLWSKLPDTAPVCFNRGMSALFSDRPAEARTALAQAIAQLPEDNAWHHLARLYLALAQM
jgi:tetratricopeptide (TPR) repeat protein